MTVIAICLAIMLVACVLHILIQRSHLRSKNRIIDAYTAGSRAQFQRSQDLNDKLYRRELESITLNEKIVTLTRERDNLAEHLAELTVHIAPPLPDTTVTDIDIDPEDPS